jgi:hypothetical protein
VTGTNQPAGSMSICLPSLSCRDGDRLTAPMHTQIVNTVSIFEPAGISRPNLAIW